MIQYNNQEYKKGEKSKDGEKTDMKNVTETFFIACRLISSL